MTKEQERNPRKALGKGLSALLPTRPSAPTPAPTGGAAVEEPPLSADDAGELLQIPVDQIERNENQPRSVFDDAKLEELAQSIRTHGLLQPITVCKIAPHRYRLVAGERRWRAAQRAGLTAIPALVREFEQQQRLEIALIENIQREDLNPIEIAKAFDVLANQHGLSHEQIAERTGKDRSTVTNLLRLLKLTPAVQQALANGALTIGHARPLLNITDPDEQAVYCERIVHYGLSVRQVENLIKEYLGANATPKAGRSEEKPEPGAKTPAVPPPLDPNVRAAIDAIAAALGTKVTLKPKSAGAGTLEIEYYSTEDLERIYSTIVE